jgi:hypothetical protein
LGSGKGVVYSWVNLLFIEMLDCLPVWEVRKEENLD